MALSNNCIIAHDNMASIASHLTELLTAMGNGMAALQSVEALDSLAKVQALSQALAPVQQAVIDAAATYTEAGNLS